MEKIKKFIAAAKAAGVAEDANLLSPKEGLRIVVEEHDYEHRCTSSDGMGSRLASGTQKLVCFYDGQRPRPAALSSTAVPYLTAAEKAVLASFFEAREVYGKVVDFPKSVYTLADLKAAVAAAEEAAEAAAKAAAAEKAAKAAAAAEKARKNSLAFKAEGGRAAALKICDNVAEFGDSFSDTGYIGDLEQLFWACQELSIGGAFGDTVAEETAKYYAGNGLIKGYHPDAAEEVIELYEALLPAAARCGLEGDFKVALAVWKAGA